MGLLMLLQKLRRSEKEARILLLGLDSAGKTTILMKLCNKDLYHSMPTQGFNIESLQHKGFKLNMWDIGGQKLIRRYWHIYYENTDALIYVIDSADSRRLASEAAEEFGNLLQEEKLAGVPILIFANKQDLPSGHITTEISAILNLDSLRDRAWHVQACSATTGEGLQEGLEWVVRRLEKK